ncbi:hypothetical protein TSTA_012630 [Talaromyces stipitatus ATCC 10500]|uniref:Uncharacterized protein n=1 Tax=Talaromyces stipitatus (strain ATCC 10500 / CBS 375.48 / QM 6759 / NRRL 1006) TaxID=441959 RepID=B8MF56_TALSN|nr:uncharacterized protein TSTA_012630 [Talaromyces stipitatus ATCC 10500]EED16155.1 hypothetical protein TSTA_012630 [Talaromyces stipitatus ATCC 10500]
MILLDITDKGIRKMPKKKANPSSNGEQRTHLSGIITSLLSAFESTRHLYRRIRNNTRSSTPKTKLNKRQHVSDDALTREEQILQHQLQQAPRQIATIFRTNSERLGEGYRRGDERAKTSLNRILLVLNTGLTKIISNFLRKNGSADNDAMIRDLMSLSERSARYSVIELEGFRMRLESTTSLGISDGRVSLVQRRNRESQEKNVGGQVRRPNNTPTGQTGTVSANGQGKTRVEGVKKSKGVIPNTSSTMGTTKTKTSTTPKRNKAPQQSHPVWVRSKNSSTISIDLRPINNKHTKPADNAKPRSTVKPPHTATKTAMQSSPDIPSTSIPAHYQRAQLPEQLSYPVVTAHAPDRRREVLLDKRLSMISHSSASTKLGEIPQHKWINAWIPPIEVDDEEDVKNEGDIHDTNGGQNGRTGVKFWRRFGRNRT